jgi:DNA sulfur modification protein DndD
LRKTVQEKASEAFRAMITQKTYQGLQINENYGLKIVDQNGEEAPSRSAGAEQIVALSLIDGLSRSGRASGPVVMDTPFGRLDTKHRKNILAYLPNSASQLVLFVHDGEIRGTDDLATLAHRIGGQYDIIEVSPSHSKLERRR